MIKNYPVDYHAKKFWGHFTGNWKPESREKFRNAIMEYRELERNLLIKGLK